MRARFWGPLYLSLSLFTRDHARILHLLIAPHRIVLYHFVSPVLSHLYPCAQHTHTLSLFLFLALLLSCTLTFPFGIVTRLGLSSPNLTLHYTIMVHF